MPRNHVSPPGEVRAPERWWRLPDLGGRRAKVVLAAYAVTALVTLTVIAGSFWFNARDFFDNIPTAAEYGFRTRTNDGIPEIATVTRRELGRSDLREEDRILSIDGIALPPGATEFTVAERLDSDEDGRAVIVTRSADGRVRTHQIDRMPVTRDTIEGGTGLPLWLFIAVGFGAIQLPLLIWFGASLLLAWRRPRDPEAMLFAFAFMLTCVNPDSAFWLHAIAGVPSAASVIILNLSGNLILVAIAAFPDGRFESALSRLALAAIGLLTLTVFAVPLFDLPQALMDGFAIVSIVAALGSVWLRYRHASDQSQRQQIKWAVFGFCAALVLFLPALLVSTVQLVPDDGLLPFLLYQLVYPLSLLLIPVGLLVSLLRYRLYDADAVISHSAAYAALTLFLAAIFAASAQGLEWAFETNFSRDAGALPSVIAAALAVLAFTPLNNRIQKWAERRFQKDLVQLRRDLPECAADLREISSLDRLLDTILEKLAAGVRAERAAMVIGRDVAATLAVGKGPAQSWFDRAELDPAVESLGCDPTDNLFPVHVPLRVRHGAEGNFGWLLLGPRPDDSFYGRDERETLAELADPIARAVQIVLVREAREAEGDRQRIAQEERLSAIEQKLAAAVEAIAKTSPPPATG